MAAQALTSLDELTPAWLTGVLQESGHLGNAQVSSLEVDEIGVGRGYVGLTLRLRPRYDQHVDRAPSSLVAKLPTFVEWPAELIPLIDLLYTTEIRWYETLRERCPLAVPGFVWAAMDAPNHRYCLLLEDMGSLRVADQVGSCSLEDATLAVRELGRLHAAHWNDEASLSHDWLPGLALMSMFSQMVYLGGWEKFWAHLGPSLPGEFESVGAAIGPAMGSLLELMERDGRTLVHGDYRLENFMFREDGSLVVLDWQLAHAGGGAQDLAYFLSQNLTVEARREHQESLIDTYFGELVAGGVADYSREQLMRDFRAGLLVAMTIPVNGIRTLDDVTESGGGVTTEEERALLERALASGLQLVTTMSERNVAAIFDNDAHLLLQELAASRASSS